MTVRKKRDEDDGIIFLETDSRDAVAKALEEAERAIEAVEERHRQQAGRNRPGIAGAAARAGGARRAPIRASRRSRPSSRPPSTAPAARTTSSRG